MADAGSVAVVLAVFVHDEVEIRETAMALGLLLPCYTQQQRPGLFASWADRVALAASLHARGRLTPESLDECDRQLGLSSSRYEPPPLEWGAPDAIAEGIHAAASTDSTIIDLSDTFCRERAERRR